MSLDFRKYPFGNTTLFIQNNTLPYDIYILQKTTMHYNMITYIFHWKINHEL